MKEKELREKMAGLYGGVPADTHAAFEHALTHHRERENRPVRMSKMRFAVLVTLLVMLLATGAYAVYYRFSVVDFMGNSSQAFLDHVITLDETYENDIFTMTVNDLVFDGENFAVAMNILRHDPDSAYYMRTRVTATCAGEEYMVDVEGSRGPDFLAGGMWPEYGGSYKDPVAAEQQGFGFDGVLWDWDMNPPPAGEPIEWTMTFTVFRPLWEIVVDEDFHLTSAALEEELERRIMDAYHQQQIYMYGGDANSYILVVADELDVWDLAWNEMVTATGAFELADVITFHFTTDFDDDVVREELIGQRYELGDYAVVIDALTVTFQRVSCTMHVDFGRPMSREELEAADLPNHIRIFREDGEALASTSVGITLGDEGEYRYDMVFSFFAYMDGVTALEVQGYCRDGYQYTPREDFRFTIELP